MQGKCDNCGKYFNTDGVNCYRLHKIEVDGTRRLCSPSCLVEYAWKEKEGQVKLPKSNSGSFVASMGEPDSDKDRR